MTHHQNSGSADKAQAAGVRTKSNLHITKRRKTMWRLAALGRYLETVLRRDGEINPTAWLSVRARIMNEAPEGKVPIGRTSGPGFVCQQRFITYPGLSLGSLAAAAEERGLRPDVPLEQIYKNALAYGGKRISGREIKRRLGLIDEDITNTKGGGHLSWETKEQKKTRRLKADAQRKKKKRQEAKHEERKAEHAAYMRAQRGRVPREEYLANSVARTIEAANIPRSTWYRKAKLGQVCESGLTRDRCVSPQPINEVYSLRETDAPTAPLCLDGTTEANARHTSRLNLGPPDAERLILRGQPSEVEAASKGLGPEEKAVPRHERLEAVALFVKSKMGPVTHEDHMFLREQFGLMDMTAAEMAFVERAASRPPYVMH